MLWPFDFIYNCQYTIPQSPHTSFFPGAIDHSARLRPSMFTLLQYLNSIDKDVNHPHRVKSGFIKSGAIGDRLRIENGQVGIVTGC